MKRTNKQSGFTLVELAIVLVIIGLIVGGVLVGQDLIKAAQIRAVQTDIEKYNAGATTFQTKYGGLPGDLLASKAQQFSAPAINSYGGAQYQGDGNGLVEGCAGTLSIGCESAAFWADLGWAGLIPGAYNGYISAPNAAANRTTVSQALTAGNVGQYVPTSKLRDSARVGIYTYGGRNYFGIGAITQANNSGAITYGHALSPLEMSTIDSKIDDGLPQAGTMVASDNNATGSNYVAVCTASGVGTVNGQVGIAVPGCTGANLPSPGPNVPRGIASPDFAAGAAAGTATTCLDGSTSPISYNLNAAYSAGINCTGSVRSSF